MTAGASARYRVDPDGVRSICAAVDAEQLDRTAVPDALESALQALQSVNDPLTDQIIYLLGGIAGDLHDATARIDARVGRANRAAAQALAAVEAGDEQMRSSIASDASVVDPALAQRFAGRAR